MEMSLTCCGAATALCCVIWYVHCAARDVAAFSRTCKFQTHKHFSAYHQECYNGKQVKIQRNFAFRNQLLPFVCDEIVPPRGHTLIVGGWCWRFEDARRYRRRARMRWLVWATERSKMIAASVIFRSFEVDEENVKCHHVVEYLQQLYNLT